MDKRKYSNLCNLPVMLWVVFSIALISISTSSLSAEDSWSKIFEFQTKMAENGSVSAQFILGEMYQEGRGVKQNYKTSLEWFQKAEGNGHKQAGKRVAEVKGLIANPPKKQKVVARKSQAKAKSKPKSKPRKKAQTTAQPKIKAKAKPQQKAKPKQTSVAKKSLSKKPPTKPVAIKPAQPDTVNKAVQKQEAAAKKSAKPRKPVDTTLMDAIGGFDDEEDAEVVTLEE